MSNPQGDIDKLVQSLYGIISPYSASIANTALDLVKEKVKDRALKEARDGSGKRVRSLLHLTTPTITNAAPQQVKAQPLSLKLGQLTQVANAGDHVRAHNLHKRLGEEESRDLPASKMPKVTKTQSVIPIVGATENTETAPSSTDSEFLRLATCFTTEATLEECLSRISLTYNSSDGYIDTPSDDDDRTELTSIDNSLTHLGDLLRYLHTPQPYKILQKKLKKLHTSLNPMAPTKDVPGLSEEVIATSIIEDETGSSGLERNARIQPGALPFEGDATKLPPAMQAYFSAMLRVTNNLVTRIDPNRVREMYFSMMAFRRWQDLLAASQDESHVDYQRLSEVIEGQRILRPSTPIKPATALKVYACEHLGMNRSTWRERIRSGSAVDAVVKACGLGALALVTLSRIRLTKRSTLATGLQQFCRERPSLRRLCETLDDIIVRPVLRGEGPRLSLCQRYLRVEDWAKIPSSVQDLFAFDSEPNLLESLKHRHEGGIVDLLYDYQNCPKNASRMSSQKALFSSLFEAQTSIPRLHWASIGTLPDSEVGRGSHPLEKAEVLYFTPAEYAERVDRGEKFEVPIVVRRGVALNGREKTNFTEALGRCDMVDVQDPLVTTSETSACRMKTAEVLSRLKKRRSITRLDPDWGAMNLLNVSDLVDFTLPEFLNRPRFRLLTFIWRRILNTDAGKVKSAKLSKVDLISCNRFMIFATAGSVSGLHIDLLNGTWIACLSGLKLWPFLPNPTPKEKKTFEEQGDEYIPEPGRMKCILLEMGDVLIMPPGEIIMHSPVTIEDCLMCGGQIWDETRIIDILTNMLWIMENPQISNEDTAEQLPAFLEMLEKITREKGAAGKWNLVPRGQTASQFRREFDEIFMKIKRTDVYQHVKDKSKK